jgi:uncharacterized lipoprotein YddW (UPF0748 family)
VTTGDPALRIRQQQKALTDKLDKLQSLGINTVFFRSNRMAPRYGRQKFCRGPIC